MFLSDCDRTGGTSSRRCWRSTDGDAAMTAVCRRSWSQYSPPALLAVLLLAAALTAPRGADAQSWSQIASGTNVTGVAKRFFLYPPSCESDPCVSACTDLLVNSFSRAASGSFVTYINLYVLPVREHVGDRWASGKR